MYRIRHKLRLTMYTSIALKTNALENLICGVVRIRNSCTVVDNVSERGSSSILSNKDVKITILNCIADCVRLKRLGQAVKLALNFSTAGMSRYCIRVQTAPKANKRLLKNVAQRQLCPESKIRFGRQLK